MSAFYHNTRKFTIYYHLCGRYQNILSYTRKTQLCNSTWYFSLSIRVVNNSSTHIFKQQQKNFNRICPYHLIGFELGMQLTALTLVFNKASPVCQMLGHKNRKINMGSSENKYVFTIFIKYYAFQTGAVNSVIHSL